MRKVRYGNQIVETAPASGVKGTLCYSAPDNTYFFRVYHSDGEFIDYDLRHDDLDVTISDDELASFYYFEGDQLLDHSPAVLGLEELAGDEHQPEAAASEETSVRADAHANGASTIPTITVFERSPDRGQGLARDMAVRWALEEVGQPYEVQLVSFPALKEAEHRTRHPFGQIPTYEEGGLVLFESGAIVLHIAERHEGLLPCDPDDRARAIMWMFSALSTVEPQIVQREVALYLESDEAWHAQRLPIIENRIRTRLDELSARLGDAEWLEGEFSAGDLMMVQVLRRLKGSNLLEEFPRLTAYVARGEARPAFTRAFDAQLAVFTGNPRRIAEGSA